MFFLVDLQFSRNNLKMRQVTSVTKVMNLPGVDESPSTSSILLYFQSMRHRISSIFSNTGLMITQALPEKKRKKTEESVIKFSCSSKKAQCKENFQGFSKKEAERRFCQIQSVNKRNTRQSFLIISLRWVKVEASFLSSLFFPPLIWRN